MTHYTINDGAITRDDGVPMLSLVRTRGGDGAPTAAELDAARDYVARALTLAQASGTDKLNVHITADESILLRQILSMHEAQFSNCDLAAMQHIIDELDSAYPEQIGMFEPCTCDEGGSAGCPMHDAVETCPHCGDHDRSPAPHGRCSGCAETD